MNGPSSSTPSASFFLSSRASRQQHPQHTHACRGTHTHTDPLFFLWIYLHIPFKKVIFPSTVVNPFRWASFQPSPPEQTSFIMVKWPCCGIRARQTDCRHFLFPFSLPSSFFLFLSFSLHIFVTLWLFTWMKLLAAHHHSTSSSSGW